MSKGLFTKSELTRLSLRHNWGLQAGHNYARMQGLGYYYSILPALKKIYADDPEALDKSARTHVMYYNTTPQMSEIIIGMNIAIEEEQGVEALETVVGLKTGLMGPFAAFGDVIFHTIQGTVFGAIAGNMALDGNPTGMFIWMAWYVAVWFIRVRLFHLGYNSGAALVTTMSDKLESITNGTSIVGLMMVGALISSVVNLKFVLSFTSGEITMSLQENLDKIMPFIPQIILVVIMYWLSGKKGMTTTKLIFVVMIVAIILAAAKIIA